MDIRKIEKLIDLLEESGIDELEISEGGVNPDQPTRQNVSKHTANHDRLQISEPHTEEFNQLPTTPKAEEIPGIALRSPMVGTFYSPPTPTSAAFMSISQTVTKGEKICIVEAMKMMNHVQAEASGVIQSILVENGQTLGQPLAIQWSISRNSYPTPGT